MLSARPITLAITLVMAAPTLHDRPDRAANILSASQVYARIQHTLTRHEDIYSATLDLRNAGIPQRTMQWIDGRNNVARRAVLSGPAPHFTYILTAHATYVHQSNRSGVRKQSPDPWTRATPHLLAALEALSFASIGPESRAPTRVNRQSLGHRQVLVLTRQGRDSSGEASVQYVHALYLDARTLLPIVQVYKSREVPGRARPGTGWTVRRIVYRHRFLPRSSLPRNFFAPASLAR